MIPLFDGFVKYISRDCWSRMLCPAIPLLLVTSEETMIWIGVVVLAAMVGLMLGFVKVLEFLG